MLGAAYLRLHYAFMRLFITHVLSELSPTNTAKNIIIVCNKEYKPHFTCNDILSVKIVSRLPDFCAFCVFLRHVQIFNLSIM